LKKRRPPAGTPIPNSANRAEHRVVDGHELVAFDLPAANGFPAEIGWELFGGPDGSTLIATGQAATFDAAKGAAEAAFAAHTR
jgi:hypothetical protein